MTEPRTPHPADMMNVFLTNPDGEVESVWAEKVGPQTAILWNIPACTPGYGYHDLVRFNPEHEVITRLVAQTETAYLQYAYRDDVDATTHAEMTARYRQLWEYFQGHGIPLESAIAGVAVAARPLVMSPEHFADLVDQAPVPCDLWADACGEP